jgi:Putative zinc-finger
MSDCLNEEMRDLLPDLAAERLTGAERTRVASHVASCPACAAEVELLGAARRVISRGAPSVDVARIVALLPKPPVVVDAKPTLVPSVPVAHVVESPRARVLPGGGRRVGRPTQAAGRPSRMQSWLGWRIAAVAMVAVGGLTVAVLHQLGPSPVGHLTVTPQQPEAPQDSHAAPAVVSPPSTSVQNPAASSQVVPNQATANQVATNQVASAPESASTDAGAGLAVASDISDLSDGEVETLLQDMKGFDGQPSADPDAAAPDVPAVLSP